MSENNLKRIIRKTGRKPIECKCEQCKNQCRTPCLGTPQDILNLLKAGYREYLKPSLWLVGMATGKLTYPIPMIQTERRDEWCVFRNSEGLCKLHNLGLKPTEGKLSHHSITSENFVFSKSLSYQVAKEWLNPDNFDVLNEITSYYESS